MADKTTTEQAVSKALVTIKHSNTSTESNDNNAGGGVDQATQREEASKKNPKSAKSVEAFLKEELGDYMAGMPRTEMAVLASGVVGLADQMMRAVHDHKEHNMDEAKAHYVKAAISAAIAIGAYELLKKDEEGLREDDHNKLEHHEEHGALQHRDSHHRDAHHNGEHYKGHHSDGDSNGDSDGKHHEKSGHKADLLAEAVGAYAIGRQMLGHKDHKILKLIAEGLGATALAREVDRELI
jgi:hypothetical protein